eukprot:286594-Prymnesium_polylepis.1
MARAGRVGGAALTARAAPCARGRRARTCDRRPSRWSRTCAAGTCPDSCRPPSAARGARCGGRRACASRHGRRPAA